MNFSGIIKSDVSNGPGNRLTLFVSGCPHKCTNCFNASTWDKNSGKYLEVANNSTADGASVGQWESTGYKCQKWTLRKEGIQ